MFLSGPSFGQEPNTSEVLYFESIPSVTDLDSRTPSTLILGRPLLPRSFRPVCPTSADRAGIGSRSEGEVGSPFRRALRPIETPVSETLGSGTLTDLPPPPPPPSHLTPCQTLRTFPYTPTFNHTG